MNQVYSLRSRLLQIGVIVVFSMVSLQVSADSTWIGGDAAWFDSTTNWDGSAFPVASDVVRIRNGATVDFDATGQPGDLVTIDSIKLGSDGGAGENAFLNLLGGTLRTTLFDRDSFKIGTAIGKVNQTGGTAHASNGGIRIGQKKESDPNQFGSWTISGGSIITSGPGDLGRLVVGEFDGKGELTIEGTGPTEISVATRFEVESRGVLSIVLDEFGVTPIVAGQVGDNDQPRFGDPDPNEGYPGAMLDVDFSALSTTIGDILLVENLTSDALLNPSFGNDQFVNALHDTTIHTFPDGTSYKISYEYEAGTDSLLNDLALVAVAAPALPGDFDDDGDVDGYDFLAWQRGESPNPLSATDLADWESSYGSSTLGASSSVVSVPEPATVVLLTCVVAFGIVARTARRPNE